MSLMVTLRVSAVGVFGWAGGALADGDAVPDGDFAGSNEDVFDEQPQDPAPFVDRGGLGLVTQLCQESLQVGG